MDCAICACITFYPTSIYDDFPIYVCETCQLDVNPDAIFDSEIKIGSVDDKSIVFTEDPDEVEDTIEVVACCRCKSENFTLCVTCKCEKKIACEDCYSKTKECRTCRTTTRHVFITTQLAFQDANRFTCPWCAVSTTVAEYVDFHLKSDVYCVKDKRKEMALHNRSRLETLLIQQGREAMQSAYDAACSAATHPNNPFESYYWNIKKKEEDRVSRKKKRQVAFKPRTLSNLQAFTSRVGLKRGSSSSIPGVFFR